MLRGVTLVRTLHQALGEQRVLSHPADRSPIPRTHTEQAVMLLVPPGCKSKWDELFVGGCAGCGLWGGRLWGPHCSRSRTAGRGRLGRSCTWRR